MNMNNIYIVNENKTIERLNIKIDNRIIKDFLNNVDKPNKYMLNISNNGIEYSIINDYISHKTVLSKEALAKLETEKPLMLEIELKRVKDFLKKLAGKDDIIHITYQQEDKKLCFAFSNLDYKINVLEMV